MSPSLDLSEVRNGQPLSSHLNLMRRPACWPRYPVLPLKRGDVFAYTPEQPTVGYLPAQPGQRAEEAPEPVVFYGDMYGVLPRPEPSSRRYESLEAILEDGWGVD